MESIDIVKLAGAGDITAFQSAVSDAVIERLQTRITDYKQELASSYSDVLELSDDE